MFEKSTDFGSDFAYARRSSLSWSSVAVLNSEAVGCVPEVVSVQAPAVPEKLREGRGAEATEVPRGILFHDYIYDNRGQVVKANCIIPTTQNTQCIDDDMKELVPWMLGKGMSKEIICRLAVITGRLKIEN